MAGDDLTGALAAWLAHGGPGFEPLPTALVQHVIEKTPGRTGQSSS
ncbi:hypothetical protein [Cellulomonas humilata]|nr:hypothetical protein [Cellulomonas humilata]